MPVEFKRRVKCKRMYLRKCKIPQNIENFVEKYVLRNLKLVTYRYVIFFCFISILIKQ